MCYSTCQTYLISTRSWRKKASEEEGGILEKSFKVCSNWQGKCKALSAFHNTGNISL